MTQILDLIEEILHYCFSFKLFRGKEAISICTSYADKLASALHVKLKFQERPTLLSNFMYLNTKCHFSLLANLKAPFISI